MDIPSPDPNMTTADVLDALHATDKPLHEWGTAIDGTPMLAARSGGDKQPAIFITAGSHAPETAGVHGALNLLNGLDTEHEVHILPLRDPLGFAGANHCLSFAAGQPVEVSNHKAVLDYLQAHAQLIWHEEDKYLFKLGDIGFMWCKPMPGYDSFLSMHSRMLSLIHEDPDILKPLRGKSVMLITATLGVEGGGEMRRCWHGVVSARGEWLHLNRFFGRDDAPPEVAAVDRLMQTVRPGLTCDLHEGFGTGFWTTIPKPKENPERVFDMTKSYFDHINARGYPIMTYEEYTAKNRAFSRGYTSEWVKPEPRVPGFFWVEGLLRGEGSNLGDYAGRFGIGYGTESSIELPLVMRVDVITNGILAAIGVWEETI